MDEADPVFMAWDQDESDDFDGAFSSLSGIPAGLSDGDDNTQLNETQVDNFVSDNNFLVTTGGTMTGNLAATGNTNISGFNAAFGSVTSTSYTLLVGDNGKVITLNNAGAITLTVPASLPAGFNCLIVQTGAGQVTFAASGTTIQNRQSNTKTAGQYAIATLVHLGSNIFVTSGDME